MRIRDDAGRKVLSTFFSSLLTRLRSLPFRLCLPQIVLGYAEQSADSIVVNYIIALIR